MQTRHQIVYMFDLQFTLIVWRCQ